MEKQRNRWEFCICENTKHLNFSDILMINSEHEKNIFFFFIFICYLKTHQLVCFKNICKFILAIIQTWEEIASNEFILNASNSHILWFALI